MSEPAITFADGSASDLEAVVAVMEDAFDARYGEAWTASQCAGLLPLGGVWLRLARSGGEVAGFALARATAGEAELLLLAVRREAQRNGIGRALLDDFEDSANRRGAGYLHLEVRDGNHAVKLYEQAGYDLIGRRRNYYRGTDGYCYDALTLAKSIGVCN